LTGASPPTRSSRARLAVADRALARGRFAEATAAYRRAALHVAENAPIGHAMASRASLEGRDAVAAASVLAALEATGAHGPAIDARRASIRAGLAALDGRPADALALYADASHRFRDVGLPVDEALSAIEMATLLDPALPEVRAAADAARWILVRQRARPFLDRLDAAMARDGVARVTAQG